MRFFRDRRGSALILIILIFSSIIVLISVFINASKEVAIKSSVKNLSYLWCNNILAEYDNYLYDDYGIFAYNGDGDRIKKRLDYYSGASFSQKKYIDYGGSEIETEDYSLENPLVFKEAILRKAKADLIAIDKLEPGDKESNSKQDDKKREIRNDEVIQGLPSKEIKMSGIASYLSIIKEAKSLKGIIKSGSEEVLINKYINKNFGDEMSGRVKGASYFANEKEYIIFGRMSDKQNCKSARTQVVLIRNAANLAYLLKDAKKQAEVTLAAALITPGPEAAITRGLLNEAWAFLESENDYKLMVNGKKVPKIKDEKSWATTITTIVENREHDYIDMNNATGDTYIDYLNAILYLMDENVKILRIMDLIQINAKFNYDSGFLLSDYYTGLNLNLTVNGKRHQIYDKY